MPIDIYMTDHICFSETLCRSSGATTACWPYSIQSCMRLPFIQIIGANPIWYSTWLSRDPLHQPIRIWPPLRCCPFPPPQSREADSKRICESFRYSSSFLLQFGIDRPYFRFSVGLPSSSSGILPHAKLSCSSLP